MRDFLDRLAGHDAFGDGLPKIDLPQIERSLRRASAIHVAECTEQDMDLLRVCLENHRHTWQDDNPAAFKKNIIKPWGYECLSYHSGEFAVWELFIKNGEQTSFHCHQLKQTVMVPVVGVVKCQTLAQTLLLGSGQMVIVDRGVFHSTEVVSLTGAIVIEIDSPPRLTDIVRARDKYGREGKPYFTEG